ncbi:MAG: hypothetical protein EZS28_037213, partial [Streblomastix strix]
SYAVQSQANGWVGSAKISPSNQQNIREIEMLQTIAHPFIIPYVGRQDINQHDIVFTELADNYSLADLLNGCQLNEHIVQKITWQILLALQKIHKTGFVHGNLKLDNIIFRSNQKTGGIDVQLSNFSLGRLIGERVILKENGSSCGGLYYAPESFFTGAVADPRMDMFSFGLILYLMLTKNHPIPFFTLQEYCQFIQQIQSQDPWFQIDEHISPEAADLITLLLAPIIDQRMTVVQPEGKWLKWNAATYESLPKQLFDYAYGEGNAINNRIKLIQSQEIGGKKRRRPLLVTPEPFVPVPLAPSGDWPNEGITPVIAGQVVTKCFYENKIPSEFHMQVFIAFSAQDDRTKGHIARLKIFDEYLKRLNSYIPPLEEKLQEFNQRRRAELVRIQALEATRVQQGS